MSKPTIASLTAALAAAQAGNDGLREQLDHLAHRIRHDYIEVAEYRRVQAVLRTTQQFLAKRNAQAKAAAAAPIHSGRPNPERLAAYFVANPGRKSVSPAELSAWEGA